MSHDTYELKAEYNVRVNEGDVLISKATLPKGTWIEFPASAPQRPWSYELASGAQSSTTFIEGVKIRKLPAGYNEMSLTELNDEKLYVGTRLVRDHIFVAEQSDYE